MKTTTKFVINVSLLVLLIVLFRSYSDFSHKNSVQANNEENTSDKNPPSKANSKQTSKPKDVTKGSGQRSISVLEQMMVVCEVGYTKEQIKRRLDKTMRLYGVAITEENYSRAGSALVALRKETGAKEMAVLDHMIRSHVPGLDFSFPDQAALSATVLMSH
ncbi:hypothetical protein IH824_05035 [candidate division KSB1 bacterium]|nr:hypothetical protein [candidate division KSB1 bacterium]